MTAADRRMRRVYKPLVVAAMLALAVIDIELACRAIEARVSG